MTADEQADAIKALLVQLEDLMEHFVFYGSVKDQQMNYWATADRQKHYVTLGLIREAELAAEANQDKDIRAAVQNALLAAQRAEAGGGAS